MKPSLPKLHPLFSGGDAPGGINVRLSAGDYFLHQGKAVETFALVSDGLLRVFTASGDGKEITLYKVHPGECCLLNLVCLMSARVSPAFAVAETDLEARVFPRSVFLEWLGASAELRGFVFGIMADRVTGMMELINEVTFKRLDCRLAGYLLERRKPDGALEVTHDAVAADLGTAREVVSRLLKSFEDQGLVQLGRGRIFILDAARLVELSC